MHYHVISGPRSSKSPSSILKFKDRMEGISIFIEMAKVLFNAYENPPPYEQIKINEKISIIRMQDAQQRIVFVYCDNNCDDDDNLEFKLEL